MDELRARRERILELGKRRGAKDLRVFGSVAGGTANETSDIDFLVQLEPGRSLVDLVGLKLDLEDLLGCSVDVVTVGGLKPRIRSRVVRSAHRL